MSRRSLHFALLLVLFLHACVLAAPPTAQIIEPTQPVAIPTVRAVTPTPQSATLSPAPTSIPAYAPFVLNHQPSGTVVRDLRPTVSLTFSSEMDRESVAGALSVEPTVPFKLRWEANTVHVDWLESLQPGKRYRIQVGDSAASTKGLHIRDAFSWTIEVAGVLGAVNGPTTVHPEGKVEMVFNFPMDAASVEDSFVLAPPLAGRWSWNDEHNIGTYTFVEPYALDTRYAVSFEKELRDIKGGLLPLPPRRTFTTPSPVAYSVPSGNRVNPNSTIRVKFVRAMDPSTTEAAFAVAPDVRGTFQWDADTLIFTPDQAYLAEDTRYTVTIGKTAKAADGTAILSSDYSWSFRTGQMGDVATFGFGPNVQVVDAGGRRAFQFVSLQEAPLVTFELYRLNVEQFLERYSSSFRGVAPGEKREISVDGAPLAAKWTMQTAATEVDYAGRSLQEVAIPSDVPAGMYVINMGAGKVNDQLIVVLTHYAVLVKQSERQLVAWVTQANSAPAVSVRVGVYARDGLLIAEGLTDESGVFRTEVSRDPQPLIVVAGQGGDLTASGLTDEWRNRGYSFDWWRPAPVAQNYAAYIYTDRPIYRPGQTVSFKAIIRRDADAVLSVIPEHSSITVRIRDARNNVVRTQQLISNQFGTVNGEFTIADGAMLGEYAVEVVLDGESHRQVFKVQDYRKPDYEVTVSTDATSYVAGDPIRVTVDTRYFFGEPVPNARVTIRQFEFGNDYWCSDECRQIETWFDIGRGEVVGKTDANGHFTATLGAELGAYSRPWGWTTNLRQSTLGLEATVDDGSHQTVSSYAAIKVFNAAETLRLNTNGYLKTPGQPFDVQVNLRSIFDQPVNGRILQLAVRQWNSAQGEYSTVIQSTHVTTDAAGSAVVPLTVAKPGFYQLHLSGRDRLGNELEYSRWVYVVGGAERWTGQTSDLQIAADRDSYAPGETATLLIESSFDGPALLTFERGTTRRQQLINLVSPLTRVEVPIQPDDAPNLFATVNAWQTQDTSLDSLEHDVWWFSLTTKADSRLLTATTVLPVPVTDKTLTVTIVPDKQSYAPRESATFTVRVTNARGEPVAAEVSLALVDEAIFSLSDELSGPIFDAFYFERANIVRTYNAMAPYRYLPCECGGGGGGGGGFGPGSPRSNFPDTAAWAPVLHTDWKGEATVTFNLPDNLTSWRLTAKATTADTQVGETLINITTQQPVVVRPLLPRTLTEGDRVELSAIVHNYTDSRQQILVTVDVGNLVQLTSPATQTITLSAGAQQIVGWTATAAKAGEASLTFSAIIDPHPSHLPSPEGPPSGTTPTGEGAGDAVRLTLPIQPLAVPDVATQVGEFTGAFDTNVAIPDGASDLSSVRIELSRSIAGTLLNGLEYLTGYPYGCVEQTMSRALPNAVVGRAFYQLGLGNPTLQADLPPKIDASVQRLYGYQHTDGGWGWWYDDESDAYQTAWVVFGLSVTAEAGYEVDSGVIRRGVDWLSENLNSMDERTRAFALYSAAYAGYGDLETTKVLAQRADSLDTFSQAALALALNRLGAEADARRMLDILERTAVVRGGLVYWPTGNDDGHYHEKTMASTTRSTALALSAFVHIDPNHKLESGIVRYLMSQRKQYGWGSTNETSFSIIALTDHLLARESATADTEYTVLVNGQTAASGALGKGNPAASVLLPVSQLKEGDNSLRITQSGGGQLYYTITSRVYLPQASVAAAGRVIVKRDYFDAATNKPIDSSVVAGQLVKIVVTVVMPADGFYMLVEDKLPGGLEALNESLNTTSHDGQALDYYGDSYYRWHQLGYNNKEVRGDRVSFFITELDAGGHRFTYYARAVRSGEFAAMPAEVSAMYDATVWGRSASNTLSVTQP